jgi:molecular chaperone DnaJ
MAIPAVAQLGDLMRGGRVEPPLNLTTRRKEPLQEPNQSLQEGKVQHSPPSASWLDGVKKCFDGMKC